MNQEELSKNIENAQLYQAMMMARFKESEEFKFIQNLAQVLKIGWIKDRKKSMKTNANRELCLYYAGLEDAIFEIFEAIDKTISDGEEIRAAKEFQEESKDG